MKILTLLTALAAITFLPGCIHVDEDDDDHDDHPHSVVDRTIVIED